MNQLLSAVFAVALAAVPVAAQDHGQHSEHASAAIAGDWKMTLNSPHGVITGVLKLKLEGANVTGSCDFEHMGAFDITGKVDGGKISLDMKARGMDMAVTLAGKIEGDHDQPKLSGTMTRVGESEGAPWSAVRP